MDMTTLSIRPCGDTDLSALLQLADTAVPFDHPGNLRWFQARQAFDDRIALRRHYVVEAASGSIVGYGAIEQQDADPRRFRIYLVPERFGAGIEDLLFARLRQDLHDLDAQVVWMREYSTDASLIAFVQQYGFVETHMIWDMRYELSASAGSSHIQPHPLTSEQPVELTTLQHERNARPDALARLYDLCNILLIRAQRPPLTESGFASWLAQPTLSADAFVIVTRQDSYVGVHALKRTDDPHDPHELIQEFAGLTDPSLIPAGGSALQNWLFAYAQQSQFQRINAYVSAHDSSLLALNEAIGYRRVYGYVAMEKRLETGW
jgi:hypothetical protein